MSQTKGDQMFRRTMTKAEQFNRIERLRATDGLPLLEVSARGLTERRDWVDLCGAVYPNNAHLWMKGKNGKMRYRGPTPMNADRKPRVSRAK